MEVTPRELVYNFGPNVHPGGNGDERDNRDVFSANGLVESIGEFVFGTPWPTASTVLVDATGELGQRVGEPVNGEASFKLDFSDDIVSSYRARNVKKWDFLKVKDGTSEDWKMRLLESIILLVQKKD